MDATYISSNQFIVSTDRTSEFIAGRRLKLDCLGDGIKYCTVDSATVSGLYTIITTKESELTSNLSTALYGIVEPGESGSLPDHNHDGSEGSGGTLSISGGGTSDVQTFLDLTDTPSSYGGAGQYVITTASGLEFSTPPSSVISDYYGYELVETIEASDETIDVTISGLDGAYDKEIYITFSLEGTGVGATLLSAQFNGDTGNNYNIRWDGTTTGGANSNGEATTNSSLSLGYAPLNGGAAGYANIFIESTQEKNSIAHLSRADNRYYAYAGFWTNTVDDVISIRIFTTDDVTGYVRVYKFKPISMPIPDGSKGVQTISYDYLTASGITINPGTIYLNDGVSERLCSVSQQFTKEVTGLSSATWYYLYVNPAGVEITSDNIEYSTTAPELNWNRYGYYHTTSSGWRCIGSFYANVSSSIGIFERRDNKIHFGSAANSGDMTLTTSYETFTWRVPKWEGGMSIGKILLSANDANKPYIYYRPKDSNWGGHILARSASTGTGGWFTTMADMMYNSDGQVECWVSDSYSSGNIYYFQSGFYLPDLIYTGAAAQLGTTQDDTLVSLYEGKQSVKLEYATASGIYVNPGKVEINGVLYKVTSQLTKQLTGMASDDWYYLYAKPPTSGKIITTNEIEYTNTEPTEDLVRMGYFHSTNTNWRCIGAVYSNSSSDISPFVIVDNRFKFADSYIRDVNASTVSTWTTAIFTVPFGNTHVDFRILGLYGDSASSVIYRRKGDSGAGFIIVSVRNDSTRDTSMPVLPVNDNKQGEYYWTGGTSNAVTFDTLGYVIPEAIYNR